MITLPDLGTFSDADGLLGLEQTSDARFVRGAAGVRGIATTRDRRVEFVGFERHSLAGVRSVLGYSAYYPVAPVELVRPVKVVLMDLDGTTVRSEHFWIGMIERTTASLLGDPAFALDHDDQPFVAGHSVSEHLQYCLDKYCPGRRLEDARTLYFEHTRREMAQILEGRGRVHEFQPAPGLGEFLRTLKGRGIRIGLVTSGVYEKAWPEMVTVFRQLGLGDPAQFYDAIITAGFPPRPGQVGTLGELSPKPHPWLYAEAARVGLGVDFADRAGVIGVEDSGAGICSVRLAGFAPVGMSGGNIIESGVRPLCHAYCDSLEQVLDLIE